MRPSLEISQLPTLYCTYPHYSHISLNILELLWFALCTCSQRLTLTLESAGRICEPVSVLLSNLRPSCAIHRYLSKYRDLNSKVLPSHLSIQSYLDWEISEMYCPTKTVTKYIRRHNCTLRSAFPYESFIGNMLSLRLERGPICWEIGALPLGNQNMIILQTTIIVILFSIKNTITSEPFFQPHSHSPKN